MAAASRAAPSPSRRRTRPNRPAGAQGDSEGGQESARGVEGEGGDSLEGDGEGGEEGGLDEEQVGERAGIELGAEESGCAAAVEVSRDHRGGDLPAHVVLDQGLIQAQETHGERRQKQQRQQRVG